MSRQQFEFDSELVEFGGSVVKTFDKVHDQLERLTDDCTKMAGLIIELQRRIIDLEKKKNV